jgi:hypothetical protein
MSPELVRFAAAFAQLGGPGSKKNTVAARLAGITCSRTQAFRDARSVAVNKLLDKANQIKSGECKPVTEREIDERVAELIRSPNTKDFEIGYTIRERRKSAQREERGNSAADPLEMLKEIAAMSPIAAAVVAYQCQIPPPDGCATILECRCPNCESLIFENLRPAINGAADATA